MVKADAIATKQTSKGGAEGGSPQAGGGRQYSQSQLSLHLVSMLTGGGFDRENEERKKGRRKLGTENNHSIRTLKRKVKWGGNII